MARTQFRVTGTVQGVGYRPFVYRHAVALGLAGSVRNDSAGVLVDVQGDPAAIATLGRALLDEAPPLARVTAVTGVTLPDQTGTEAFRIVASIEAGPPGAPVSVDTATCTDCLREIDDPTDRRFGYAFTNCTNCGPRYTIVLSVPYDRPATTMASFTMCDTCRGEYEDPADRRFHAQPNACAQCGPRLRWCSPSGAPLSIGPRALSAAVQALALGHVVAVKGIGGYHFAVDAGNGDAVARLRSRKARDDKPFAVMVRDLPEARRLAVLSGAAIDALTSIRRPIVLVPRRHDVTLADAVAPGLRELGLMLPYSPLHHLLLARFHGALVMTSGNHSDEPIAHSDEDAVTRLGALVDGVLAHDRPIHIRCDDSVVRATPARLQLLRRSRGYAPEPIALPFRTAHHVLAVGAELKNTIAVAKDAMVVASHHIGDLEHLATYRSFLQALAHLPALYGVTPAVVAHDLHPEYLSTKLASELDLPAVAVQHHHAHVASCLVEHGRTATVLGIAFDGLGYGPDATLWGGELLVADLAGYERVGHLLSVPLPGGVAAIREPWRMAAAWLAAAAGPAAVPRALRAVDPAARDAVVDLVLRRRGPETTSAGRLFDAVAALLGGRLRVSYEAQAAIELESLAATVPRHDAPCFDGEVVVETDRPGGMAIIDPSPLVARVVAERARGEAVATIAAGFHEALGRATASLAAQIARGRGLDTVVLTGGVFQNVRFSDVVASVLGEEGIAVLQHSAVPANDGGISIGQAAVAAWRGAKG